jgi:DNA-binding SARP family transcriptional activator
LRSELGHARDLIAVDQTHIGINETLSFKTDVHDFRCLVEAAALKRAEQLVETDAQGLERAVALWRGEPLEGIYSDWALVERERLRSMLLNALHQLMHYFGRVGEFDRAIPFGQEILRHDPLREEVHRRLMLLYTSLGERARAARQYHECASMLKRELNMEPMPETCRLYAELTGHKSDAPLESVADVSLEERLQATLVRAKRECMSARAHLQRIELLVHSLTSSTRSR